MSSLLTAEQICESALEAIGAFPTSEVSADPVYMQRASKWLDINMAQLAGETWCWWLVTSTLTIALSADQDTYDLETALGQDYPADGYLFPKEAWLEDDAVPANRYPVRIVTRISNEERTKPEQSGAPYEIHIDRRVDANTLTVYPVPAVATWNLRLVVITFAKSVAFGPISGIAPAGANAHGLRATWQRWAILQLAYDLSGGPVVRHSTSVRKQYKDDAGEAKTALLAFENREHDTEEPVCDPYDPAEHPVGRRRGPYSDYGNLY